MPDMNTAIALAAEVAQVRADAIVEAATGELYQRHVMLGFYSMDDAGNTDDGCLIIPTSVKWGAGMGSAVEVHYPADAPREEVCAVLRHIAKALETNQLPQRAADTETADETTIEEE